MADVAFANVPQNLRTPLFYAELNSSRANSAQQGGRALIIGQVTSAGTATPGVPALSLGVSDAKAAGGVGSMLALMAAAYRANDSFGEVWYLPLADAQGAVAAAGSILISGPATAAGTLNLYIAGQLVAVPVAAGMTAAQIATVLAAQIAAQTDLPVTAAVDGATTAKVNLTARNAGAAGNDIDLRLNYRGGAGGEVFPAGVGATVTAMAGGATNPPLPAALAALGSKAFDFIVSPYTDAASIAALSALLNDQTGRWSWSVQTYGHVFMACRGTVGQLAAFGAGLNDQHTTCMGFADSPSPNWVWAAAVAGAAAVSLRADPALPLQTLAVAGVLAPPIQSRFSLSLRNTLLFDGISTFTVTSGQVAIENLITTYQKNAQGQADSAYLEVETLFTLAYVLRALAGVVTSKYARVKLAADGQRFGTGANVVTPAVIRADIIAQYQELEADGFVQNSDAFAEGLIVQRNSANPNRVDVLWPGTLVGQLRIFALLAQFRLA